MTDFIPLQEALAQALADAIAEVAAASRPLSECTMLSPKDAAAHLGDLGIKSARFWLEQQGLVTTIPGVEFGAHRKTSVQLVRWGDVLDAVAAYRRAEKKRPARRRIGLAEGGLG